MDQGIPVIVELDESKNFEVDFGLLEKKITPKTKMMIVNSPSNPTGGVLSEATLKRLAGIALEKNITVISDEIYEYINFTGKHASIGAFPNVKDRTITINGFSKGFSMTGWRLGYLGAPEFIAKACAKIQGQFTSGANSFGQKAAALALSSDMTPTYDMQKAFIKRRDVCQELLNKIPGFKVNSPEGAFYFFPDISDYFGKSHEEFTINNPDDFCLFLLQYAHVGTVSGAAFGADNCFSLSYSTSEEVLRTAIGRIAKAVALLK